MAIIVVQHSWSIVNIGLVCLWWRFSAFLDRFLISFAFVFALESEQSFFWLAMASHTVKRIQTDISQVMKNDPTGQIFGLIPMSDDMTDLTGFIAGPPDSPYAGGKFKFEMKIPANFPFAPPSVRFTTRVWHPNISSATGAICLSVLKNDWTAAYTLYNVLIAIQSMLTGK